MKHIGKDFHTIEELQSELQDTILYFERTNELRDLQKNEVPSVYMRAVFEGEYEEKAVSKKFIALFTLTEIHFFDGEISGNTFYNAGISRVMPTLALAQVIQCTVFQEKLSGGSILAANKQITEKKWQEAVEKLQEIQKIQLTALLQ